jgi:hypothetical protein
MSKYHQGWYKLKVPEKYITSKQSITEGNGIRFMSSWEERKKKKKMFLFCDLNPAVKKWSSEPFPIPYFNELDQKVHHYYVDLYMEYEDGSGKTRRVLVEIKPLKETMPPKMPVKKTSRSMGNYEKAVATFIINQAKWNAAREFCLKNNIEFKVITEKELF